MFNSEREMQDIFVSLLKKRKTSGLIFEEVGNRNYFFRTDVVEYKSRFEIIGYELKIKNFKKLIEQTIKTIDLFDVSYMVIPDDQKSYDRLLKIIKDYPNKKEIERIGIIVLSDDKLKKVKKPNLMGRNRKNTFKVDLIQDLIIRGYHKLGTNCCKSYK